MAQKYLFHATAAKLPFSTFIYKSVNQEPSKDDGWGLHTSGAVFDSE